MNGQTSYEIFKFQSGELQLKVNQKSLSVLEDVEIEGSITSSNHIIELLLLVDVLRTYGEQYITLRMPYCAFSRQDRTQEGEAFSLKVFTNLINSCAFDMVLTNDNHSDVATALINNCVNISKDLSAIDLSQYDYLCSPDAGAIKQVQALSVKHQVPMIRADKTRSLVDGSITGTVVYTEDLTNKTVLIVDDLAQGAYTFMMLAKALREKNCKSISLYVTHGFFNNSLEVIDNLVSYGVDQIYTTDSVCKLEHERLTYV